MVFSLAFGFETSPSIPDGVKARRRFADAIREIVLERPIDFVPNINSTSISREALFRQGSSYASLTDSEV